MNFANYTANFYKSSDNIINIQNHGTESPLNHFKTHRKLSSNVTLGFSPNHRIQQQKSSLPIKNKPNSPGMFFRNSSPQNMGRSLNPEDLSIASLVRIPIKMIQIDRDFIKSNGSYKAD